MNVFSSDTDKKVYLYGISVHVNSLIEKIGHFIYISREWS